MKKFRYISIACLAIALNSCSENVTIDKFSEEQVQISASIIAEEITRVNDSGTEFTDDDAIKVYNTSRTSKNLAVYTYRSGSWSTSDILLWEDGDNVFNAWYPVNAAFDEFCIPADQTAGTGNADWMTASTVARNTGAAVALPFAHRLSKVTVNVDSWGSEISADMQKLSSAFIVSQSTNVSWDGSDVSGDDVKQRVSAALSTSMVSFTAIVAPGVYSVDDEILTIRLNGSSEEYMVKATKSVEFLPGKSYNYDLTVGKDCVILDEDGVSVSDWDSKPLPNIQAGEAVLGWDAPEELDVDFSGESVTYTVKANLDYKVTVPNWITYSVTPGNGADMITLDVSANKDLADRSAVVELSVPGENMATSLKVNQTYFKGIDDSDFNQNRYLTYVRNYHSYWSGDNLTNHTSYFSAPVSISKITYKFRLPSAPEQTSYSLYALGSTNTSRDSYLTIRVHNTGISFCDYNDEDEDGIASYTWAEMGVSATSTITYTIDAKNHTIEVNGKVLPGVTTLSSFSLSCLFSDYFRESDEGVYTDYGGFMEGAYLYYVKIWDSYDRLIYLGGADREFNSKMNRTEACWSSKYYSNGIMYTKNEFAHNCSESGSYTSFGGGY